MLGLWIKQATLFEWNTILARYSREQRTSNSNSTTYSAIYQPWKPIQQVQIPTPTNRPTASAFYQLKLGHGYFKSYLFKRKHTTNSLCRCGKIETAEHLLLRCYNYGDLRKQLQKELPSTSSVASLTMQLLLHTKIGIEKALAFIATTRIATRKWHLSRNEIKEEERRRRDSSISTTSSA